MALMTLMTIAERGQVMGRAKFNSLQFRAQNVSCFGASCKDWTGVNGLDYVCLGEEVLLSLPSTFQVEEAEISSRSQNLILEMRPDL